jgi:hypothetical protein
VLAVVPTIVIFPLRSDTKCHRALTFVDQVQGLHRDVLDHLTPAADTAILGWLSPRGAPVGLSGGGFGVQGWCVPCAEWPAVWQGLSAP